MEETKIQKTMKQTKETKTRIKTKKKTHETKENNTAKQIKATIRNPIW